MRLLARFLRLPSADRRLLVRSIVVLGVSRITLWVLPLRVVRRLLAPSGRRGRVAPPASPARIRWALSAARRIVPGATCLPQALAAEALLTRNGHPVELRIGVRKNDRGRLEAHAWVESRGRIVVGELHEGLSHLTPLPPLPGARA